MSQHTIDVTVSSGKYRVILPAEGGLHALRHGEPWRDLMGDNLVLSLASELGDTRKAKAELLEVLERVFHERLAPDSCHHDEDQYDPIECITCLARATIAKAKGAQP